MERRWAQETALKYEFPFQSGAPVLIKAVELGEARQGKCH